MKRLTRAKAVKIFCQTCMGCDEWYGGKAGTKPNEASIMVRECESKNCPLYNFRTGKETTPGLVKKTLTSASRSGLKKARGRQKQKQAQLHIQN